MSDNFTDRKTLEDMFADKIRAKHYVHIPECNQHDTLSAATKLLGTRQQLTELDAALRMKKEEFKIKMTGLESRRLAFKAKEQQLQSYLAKFDYYIHENDVKSMRAAKKAHLERQMCAAKEKELKVLAANAAAYIKKRNELKEKLDKHLAYAHYLEQVMKRSDEFHEIRDVMSRFETLSQTYQELHKKEETTHMTMEAGKQQHTKYVNNKNAALLSLNNKLSELQVKYDCLLTKSEQLESQMTYIESTAAGRTLQLGQIRMSGNTCNVQLVLKHSSRMSVYTSSDLIDPIEQLDKICTYIMGMSQIVEDVRKDSIYNDGSQSAIKFNPAHCEFEKVNLFKE